MRVIERGRDYKAWRHNHTRRYSPWTRYRVEEIAPVCSCGKCNGCKAYSLSRIFEGPRNSYCATTYGLMRLPPLIK